MSSQQLGSYQDGYRLVPVHTHGDFIVLHHCETMPPLPDISDGMAELDERPSPAVASMSNSNPLVQPLVELNPTT